MLVDGDVTGSLLVGGAGRGGGASGDPIIGGFMRDLEAALDAGVLSADFALASLHSVAIDDDGDPLAVMTPTASTSSTSRARSSASAPTGAAMPSVRFFGPERASMIARRRRPR